MFAMVKSVRLVAASAALALVGISSAFAGSASLVVPAGSRVCLSPIYATRHLDAQGSASPGVRFIVVRDTTTIAQSHDFATAFGASFDASYQPYYFPGSFKICARNLGSTSANVNMSINGY